MKSSYELAMERMGGGDKPLSEEQKAKIDSLVAGRSKKPGDESLYGKPGQDLRSKIQSGEIKIA